VGQRSVTSASCRPALQRITPCVGVHSVHTRNMQVEIDKEIEMDDPDDRNGAGNKMLTRPPKKTRVTMYLEPAILETFREQAANQGAGYQTLINQALRETIYPESAPLTVDALRRVLREEFDLYFGSRG
jgi:uncharacterized protein (DUF4415 family)